MGDLLRLLRAAAGEASLGSAIGRWRQAVSKAFDELTGATGAAKAAALVAEAQSAEAQAAASAAQAQGAANAAAIAQIKSTPQSRILWKPSGGGDATTWAEVMGFVAASKAPLEIYVAGDAVIPAGTYEMKDATLFGDNETRFTVRVLDNAVLRNLSGLTDNLFLQGMSSAPILDFDYSSSGSYPAASFILNFGCRLINSGTSQLWRAPTGHFVVLAMFSSQGLENPNAGVGTVLIDPGAQFVFFGDGLNPALSTYGDLAQGGATSSIIYAGFQGPYPMPAGFTGNILTSAVDVNGGSGPSTMRPFFGINGNPLLLGTWYFDTTLGLPIWWDGAKWVDATAPDRCRPWGAV